MKSSPGTRKRLLKKSGIVRLTPGRRRRQERQVTTYVKAGAYGWALNNFLGSYLEVAGLLRRN